MPKVSRTTVASMRHKISDLTLINHSIQTTEQLSLELKFVQ